VITSLYPQPRLLSICPSHFFIAYYIGILKTKKNQRRINRSRSKDYFVVHVIIFVFVPRKTVAPGDRYRLRSSPKNWKRRTDGQIKNKVGVHVVTYKYVTSDNMDNLVIIRDVD